MKHERWKQISEMFQSALGLEASERTDYLRDACGDDDRLRQEVQSLLDAHERAESAGFIGQPPIDHIQRLLTGQEALTGTIGGHYRIVRRLGMGGMGEVYLADDTELERPVAIKVLLADTARDRDRIRRFVQEARAASALNHPNILTVYQVGDHQGSRFIATEYIDGETLRDRLGKGPLDLHEALEIAIQVAAALDAAHEAGIVHRDIKPENIMLRADGLVKVLDFGLAKPSATNAGAEPPPTLARDDTNQTVTGAGTILGTAAYMSPEQARGMPVDGRSDVWSLGVLIHEMVSGRQPFAGASTSDTIAAILAAAPAPLTNCPAQLEDIVSRALRKPPGERFQTARQLLGSLRELRQDLQFAEKTRVGNVEVPVPGIKRTAHEIRKRAPAFASVLFVVACALAAAYYMANRTEAGSGSDAPSIRSIAVLPFANGTGNAEAEYLSDGLTDSVINSLSRLPGLTVKARGSVFQYKGKEVSPQAVGNELSVQAALLGRVSRMNDRTTLSLELVDTKNGDRIWGDLYTRKDTDLASLQADVAQDVAGQLGARLSGTRGSSANTPDPDAYRLYLQGLYFLNKRTADDIRKSIALFEQASTRDPSFAKAFASLASAYITLRVYDAGLSRDEVKVLASKAHAAVLRARELDDSLPEVHAMLGTMHDVNWEFSAADDEYRRAIQLNPNDASARLSHSLNLSWRGHHEEALAEIDRAYEIDPFSRSIAFNIGARRREARRFDEAIAQFRRVLEMEPDHPLTHAILAQTFEDKGMHAEAIHEHRAADVLLKKASAEVADRKAAALALALATAGAQGYWQKRLEFSREDYAKGAGSAYDIAIALARLGARNEALEQLEKSFADHELYLPWIRSETAFDAISGDPRFAAIVRRMGLFD